jgi:hypothetical protein
MGVFGFSFQSRGLLYQSDNSCNFRRQSEKSMYNPLAAYGKPELFAESPGAAFKDEGRAGRRRALKNAGDRYRISRPR